ncbi:MAG: hypothetical protein ACYTHK_07745 [Planctomycetota bacterium]
MSNQRNERGIALLTVITALVALMVIAVPFAISMRMGQERSEVNNARRRAQAMVDSILNFQKAYLLQTTERVEIENRSNSVKGKFSDPYMDNNSEIQPRIDDMATSLGVSPDELEDPYGLIAGFQVEDENGKINLNGCSFFALGNLMGMGVLTEDLNPEDTEISISDTTNFPEQGYVKIGRELIKYTGKDAGRLTGCERGLAVGSPHNSEPKQRKSGYWCVNYAAWAICYYPVHRHPGEYTPWESLDVSDISSLEKGLDPEVPVITDAFWQRITPYVTVWSKGDAGGTWGNIQDLVEGQRLPRKDEGTGDHFQFRNGYNFNAGTIVRLSESVDKERLDNKSGGDFDYRKSTIRPRRVDYGMAFEVNPQGRSAYMMRLFGKVHRRFRGNQARVEYRNNIPVNLNTASREVLIACFAHLSILRGRDVRYITRDTAGKVADAIIRSRESENPMRTLRDFRKLLTDMVAKTNEIDRQDRAAIFRTAVNSHDMGITFGTVPVTFRSFDVYTLRASAAINDSRGGRLLARHSQTRVVEIGSQVSTVKLWETQRDFEEILRRDLSTRYWTTAPNKVGTFVGDPKVQPEPRWQNMLNGKYFPWDPYETGARDEKAYEVTSDRDTQITANGDMRLDPVRMLFNLAPVEEERVYVEHFDRSGQTEGFYADQGFPLKALLLQSRVPMPDTDPDGLTQPFTIQFWWRPEADITSNAVIFDWGERDFANRITCYVQDNTLILAVSDNTETQRASELRYDLSEIGGLQQGVFYHFQLLVAGTHPSEMAMILDGRSVGTSNVQSPLAGTVAADDGIIPLEDSSGFPPRGAVIIANEVIEYEENTGGALKVRTDSEGNPIGRGARGTYRYVEHAEGTPVTLFGYSRPITEAIREGGATLDGDLAPWAMLRVETVNTNDDQPDTNISPNQAKGPFLVGGGGAGGGGGGGGQSDTKTVELNVVPFENDGDIGSFTVVPYGYDDEGGAEQPSTEQAVQAFQDGEDAGYALVVYYGGRSDDGFEDLIVNGAEDGTAPVAELMQYSRDGVAMTLTRLDDGTGDSDTANPRAEDWELLLSYRITITSTDGDGNTTTTIGPWIQSPFWIIPVSIKTTRAPSGQYVNPAEESDRTHWVMQMLNTDDDQNPIWEWVRYNEILQSGNESFFCMTKPTSEERLFDALGGNWDETIDNVLSTPPGSSGGSSNPGGSNPGGSNPGGSNPGGSNPGGSNPGGSDPGDTGPPTAPPPDDPVDPGDMPPTDGDGPGGDPGTPPDDTTPPVEGDGPGGDPGTPPDDTTPPVDEDGPGGDPGGTPDDTPPPIEGDGPGGDPGTDPGPSPQPPTDGGEPAPPPEGPTPEPGDPAPPSVKPPSNNPGDNSGGTQGGTNDFTTTAQFSRVADVLRFRGVHGNTRTAGFVDDWYVDPDGDFDNSKHTTGSLIIPMAGTYGGPRDQIATDDDGDGKLDDFGKDFSVWARPGAFDEVVIVTGDDSTMESGDLFVHHSMKSTNQRFYDNDGNDWIEPWDFDEFQHFFALTRQVNSRIDPSEDLEVRARDYRTYTRVLCFPSGEMPDNAPAMNGPWIGRSIEGAVTACTIDEITGDGRDTNWDFTLQESISATDTTIALISPEGIPNEADVPDGPGLIRVGDEMIVWDEAAIEDNALVFTGCIRGTMLSDPQPASVGTRVEPMFGFYVGILTSAVDNQTNTIPAKGLGKFPPQGVVRLEDTEAEDAELRIYTTNVITELRMPIAEGIGSGLFLGRYGSIARPFQSGTPVFYQPVRTWDRYSNFVDNPEIACFSFSAKFKDAFIKRVVWKEGQMPFYTNVRVVVRLDESVSWNAKSSDVLFLSRDGGRSEEAVPEKFQRRLKEAGSALKFLRAMEQPKAANLLGINTGVQADTVEARLYCIYEKGAFQWNNPRINAWKQSPIVQAFAIEYVQQNRTLAHRDK